MMINGVGGVGMAFVVFMPSLLPFNHRSIRFEGGGGVDRDDHHHHEHHVTLTYEDTVMMIDDD